MLTILHGFKDRTRELVKEVFSYRDTLHLKTAICRLAVWKLLSTLLSTQHAGLNQALVNTPFLANLLDLSFNKFKQNNFLHHEVGYRD